CNNSCSYCKVHLVRGPSRSRGKDDVIAEAKRVTRGGIKEIVLCGICLGAYGRDLNPRISLAVLLGELEKIPELKRIRLSSIEAGDVSSELIARIADSSKICRHLHIPIQSGDDDILKKMGRSYSRRSYLALIRKLKKDVPGISITTDILVGFPGEERDNFNNTLNLLNKIAPLKVHIFPYSRRNGTPAAVFKNDITPWQLNARLSSLKSASEECSLEYRRRFLGRKVPVLVEGRFPKRDYFWHGYTDNYIRVLLKSTRNLKNRIVEARIKRIMPAYALADLC
ncbi:MAG: MiaB/RimO family radical SAM methylthiotransferase, partial [Candidatus Paceibacterota bacterium]